MNFAGRFFKELTLIIHKLKSCNICYVFIANSIPVEERLAAMDEAKNAVKSRKQIGK